MFVSFRFGNYCKLARVNDGHTFKDIFRLVNESNLSEGYIYIHMFDNKWGHVLYNHMGLVLEKTKPRNLGFWAW